MFNERMSADLLARISSDLPRGKSVAVGKIFDAWKQLAEHTAAIRRNDNISDKGRAPELEKEVRAAGAALLKARRQYDYQAKTLTKRREAIEAKAIGEAKATDSEWRTYLRSLPPAKKFDLLTTDPHARGAALREPGLAELSAEHRSRLLDIAIGDVTTPEDHANLQAWAEAQAVHEVATDILEREIMQTAFKWDGGALRKLASPHELNAFLDGITKPALKDTASEEMEIDAA